MINIDTHLTNADWPKRTRDRVQHLALSYREKLRLQLDWDESLHPRDEQGQFADGDSGGSSSGHSGSDGITFTSKRDGWASGRKRDGKTVTVVGQITPKAQAAVFKTVDTVDVAGKVAGSIPGDLSVTWAAGENQRAGTTLVMNAYSNSGVTMQRMFQRTLQGKLIVHHEALLIPKAMQGAGVAKDILRDSMDAYQAMGVSEIQTYADLEVGGYAWAKFGFKAEDPLSLSENVKTELRRRNIPLNGPEREAVRSVIEKYAEDPKLPWHLAGIVGANGRQIGKEILMQEPWDARLDLHDPESMARFTHYVAKDR
jgi:hypothetical protein